ncbi:hypothetical protein SCHPADRAFT_895633 [Schizopora paradoxa]|uniref:Uncharacterized protein n=1 Tax=Schizopora paradoxa TaxID=27342 RepID=A0A0H2R4E5_9AGAM|nr:hypothetical protein SCHPADRAFT_895633 [Schizopora paradoxa]
MTFVSPRYHPEGLYTAQESKLIHTQTWKMPGYMFIVDVIGEGPFSALKEDVNVKCATSFVASQLSRATRKPAVPKTQTRTRKEPVFPWVYPQYLLIGSDPAVPFQTPLRTLGNGWSPPSRVWQAPPKSSRDLEKFGLNTSTQKFFLAYVYTNFLIRRTKWQ